MASFLPHTSQHLLASKLLTARGTKPVSRVRQAISASPSSSFESGWFRLSRRKRPSPFARSPVSVNSTLWAHKGLANSRANYSLKRCRQYKLRQSHLAPRESLFSRHVLNRIACLWSSSSRNSLRDNASRGDLLLTLTCHFLWDPSDGRGPCVGLAWVVTLAVLPLPLWRDAHAPPYYVLYLCASLWWKPLPEGGLVAGDGKAPSEVWSVCRVLVLLRKTPRFGS